ncbi:hypothetical protein ACLOJK_030164 [Asimina triloba]
MAANNAAAGLDKDQIFGMAEKEMEYRVDLFNRLTRKCMGQDSHHQEFFSEIQKPSSFIMCDLAVGQLAFADRVNIVGTSDDIVGNVNADFTESKCLRVRSIFLDLPGN